MLQIALHKNTCLKVILNQKINRSVIEKIIDRGERISTSSDVKHLIIKVKKGFKLEPEYMNLLLTRLDHIKKISIKTETS